MEASGHLLVVRETPGDLVAFPRRAVVRTVPGEGKLHVDGAPGDAAWNAAAGAAWAYARALVPAPAVDARVEVAGDAPLPGGSAGLPLALLFLSALLEAPLPPHAAVGHLEGAHGSVAGGALAGAKARAAADLARGLGLAAPLPFLHPPLPRAPEADPALAPRAVLDPAHALRLLAPAAYARVREAHDRHRLVGRHLPGAIAPLLPQAGPFALLVPADEDDADDLAVGRGGLLLHKRRLDPSERDGAEAFGRALLALDPDAR